MGVTITQAAKYRLKFDPTYCRMCESCAALCAMNKWGYTGSHMGAMNMQMDYDNGTVDIAFCRQCPAPSCAAVCPADAIQYDEEKGIAVTDQEACIGCGACSIACPVGAISYNKYLRKAYKCDLCGVCVEQCPGKCIGIVEVNKFGKEKPATKAKEA